MQRQRRKLTVEVAIELRRTDGWGVRAIARELGRSPSVISAELGRDTDGCYAAGPAQAAAAARWNRSGRRAKLAARGLPRWRNCCGCSRSRSRGGASAWRMERKCRPDYE
jgi:hypothetical protein